MNTAYYLNLFSKLNCAKYRGKEAPHKPVLLLAIIELFAQCRLNSGEIHPTAELEQAFFQVWQTHVHDNDFAMLLGTPFYHMKTEAFWQFDINSSCGISIDDKYKLKNLNTLRKAGAYATLDPGLVKCLQNPEARQQLQTLLINRYFHRQEPETPQQTQTHRCRIHTFNKKDTEKTNKFKHKLAA